VTTCLKILTFDLPHSKGIESTGSVKLAILRLLLSTSWQTAPVTVQSIRDILEWTHSRTFLQMLPLATSSLLLKILIFSTLYIVVFYISLIALDLASILTLLLIHIFTAFDYF